MYSALLEAVGVMQLAKKALIDRADAEPDFVRARSTPDAIYDLDCNVMFYAMQDNAQFVDFKFNDKQSVPARELPADLQLDIQSENTLLIQSFRLTGKQLFGLDLTTPDLADLGLTVTRVWSPDTISLSLPSAPPLRHRRFAAYGGASHTRPHPYP
jgi:hypothetical protein